MADEEQGFVVVVDDNVFGFNTADFLLQLPDKLRELQQWLKPTDYNSESSEYKKHLTSYVAGTGMCIQKEENIRSGYSRWSRAHYASKHLLVPASQSWPHS